MEARERLKEEIKSGLIELSHRERCICGCSDVRKIASIDRLALDFPSYICSGCGIIFTNPYISDKSIQRYYNLYYHQLMYGRSEPLEHLFSKEQGKNIFNFVKGYLKTKDLRIFELGAGTGSNLTDFKREAARRKNINVTAYGIEFNEEYVNKGRQKGLCLTSRSIEEYVSNEKARYDLIILSHVIEHFTDIEKTIGLLKELAHPETLFYIEAPGILDLKWKYEYNCDLIVYLIHAHIFNFSLNSLTRLLNMYGLELIKGDEKIRSIFIMRDSASKDNAANTNFAEIMKYLADLSDKLEYYQWLNKKLATFRRRWRRLTGLPGQLMHVFRPENGH